jgi:hypothetical protein
LPGRERGTSRCEYIRDAGDRPAVRVRGLPADSLRSLADLLQPDRLRRVLETHYFRVDKGARAPSSKIVATHLKLAARQCGLLPPQAVQAVETLANQVKAPNSGYGPAGKDLELCVGLAWMRLRSRTPLAWIFNLTLASLLVNTQITELTL